MNGSTYGFRFSIERLGSGAYAQQAYADETLAGAEQSESRKNLSKGHRLKGQAFMAQGNLEEAEREVALALQIAIEIGNPVQLWRTQVALAELRRAQGKSGEVADGYRQALVATENVAKGLRDEGAKRIFLESDEVAAIRKEAS